MTTKQGYRVAVLGATGLVGSKIIEILEARDFPVSELVPLASARSVGGTVLFKGQSWLVQEACADAFDNVDIVLASAGATVSEKLAPEAAKRGAIVIDNTSFFRMQPDIPLVVAGVNDEDLRQHQGIIANPNCSTAQLMPVLKTLHQLAGLKRVIVSTYQSVSGAGKSGLDELAANTRARLSGEAVLSQTFQRPIGFNLIPQIDKFLTEPLDPVWGEAAGYTKEEAKLMLETRKILHLPELRISATAVRVPVEVGHSESVTLEFDRPLSVEAATEALKNTPDVVVASDLNDYHTPRETAGTDPVYVSRLRSDASNPETGLCLWVVSDNLRIGAALNAVRIAERLVAMKLVNRPAKAWV